MPHTDQIYSQAKNVIFTQKLQLQNLLMHLFVWFVICKAAHLNPFCLDKAGILQYYLELKSQRIAGDFLSYFQIRHIVMCVTRETPKSLISFDILLLNVLSFLFKAKKKSPSVWQAKL